MAQAQTTKTKANGAHAAIKGATSKAPAKRAKPVEEQPAPVAEVSEDQRKGDRRANDQIKADAAMKFNVAQATAQPTADAKAEFDRRVAELAKEMGIQAKVTTKQPRSSGIVQNGITRPAPGTKCAVIFDLADKLSTEMNGVVAIATLKAREELKEFNDHTLKTQYQRWRKFHNVSGRLPRIHAVHQVQGQYEALEPKK